MAEQAEIFGNGLPRDSCTVFPEMGYLTKVYVADHQQVRLVPIEATSRMKGEVLLIDGQ
jgi:hypothetical protein